jgi:hypothetical protein
VWGGCSRLAISFLCFRLSCGVVAAGVPNFRSTTPNAKWNGTPRVDQHRFRAQDHSKSYTLLKGDYDLPNVMTKPSWMAHADLALARSALGKARGEVVNVGCSIICGARSRRRVTSYGHNPSSRVTPCAPPGTEFLTGRCSTRATARSGGTCWRLRQVSAASPPSCWRRVTATPRRSWRCCSTRATRPSGDTRWWSKQIPNAGPPYTLRR